MIRYLFKKWLINRYEELTKKQALLYNDYVKFIIGDDKYFSMNTELQNRKEEIMYILLTLFKYDIGGNKCE